MNPEECEEPGHLSTASEGAVRRNKSLLQVLQTVDEDLCCARVAAGMSCRYLLNRLGTKAVHAQRRMVRGELAPLQRLSTAHDCKRHVKAGQCFVTWYGNGKCPPLHATMDRV